MRVAIACLFSVRARIATPARSGDARPRDPGAADPVPPAAPTSPTAARASRTRRAHRGARRQLDLDRVPEAKCRDGSSTGIGVRMHPGATQARDLHGGRRRLLPRRLVRHQRRPAELGRERLQRLGRRHRLGRHLRHHARRQPAAWLEHGLRALLHRRRARRRARARRRPRRGRAQGSNVRRLHQRRLLPGAAGADLRRQARTCSSPASRPAASAPRSTTIASRRRSAAPASRSSTTPARRCPTTTSRPACSSAGASCGTSTRRCPPTAPPAAAPTAAASSTTSTMSPRSIRRSSSGSSRRTRTASSRSSSATAQNNCAGLSGPSAPMSGAKFEAGLDELRGKYFSQANLGSYIVPSDVAHLETALTFYSTTVTVDAAADVDEPDRQRALRHPRRSLNRLDRNSDLSY